MSWEQRNHDFSTALVDAQAAYIGAEREVKRLQAENDKLRELCSFLYRIHVAEQEWQGAEPYRTVKARMEELGVEV